MPPLPLEPGIFKHGDIQVSAAGHQVRVGLVKDGSAGNQRHRHFHRVHQIVVFFAGLGAAAHAENSVFAVKIHGQPLGQVIGDKIRDAPAEIHVSAVRQFLRGALGNLFSSQP